MKGSIVTFVKIANSFLFFFGFIFLLLFVAYQVYDANFRERHSTHNSIQITDKNDAASKPLHYKKVFVKKYEDVYVFEVRSNRLLSSNLQSEDKIEVLGMFSGGSKYDDFETVNFLFARDNAAPTLLLDSHALVLKYDLIRISTEKDAFYGQLKTNKHLFSVVVNDNNKDKVLDKKDQINLLASDYNGENLITIAKDIKGYHLLGSNKLLITQRKGNETITLTYDLFADSSIILNTDLPSQHN